MIYKSKQTSNYTVIPNDIFTELKSGLSIGILTYLLSRPKDWITYKKQLYGIFSEGRISIDKAFKELEAKGYIIGIRSIGKDGKITGYEWIVYDTPVIPDHVLESEQSDDQMFENRLTENRLMENQQSEIEQLLNKEIQSKEIINKEMLNDSSTKNKFSQDVTKTFDYVVKFFEDTKPKTEVQKNKWLDCIDKLNRIDGLSFREICEIVKLTKADSFWSSNFLSVLKLRNTNKEGVHFWSVFKSKIKSNTQQELKPIVRTIDKPMVF